VKYACIAQYRPEYPLGLMCRVLGVSRSGFFKAQRRGPSARALADERDRLLVRAAYAASHGRYGAPRVCEALAQAGTPVSLQRVARLMREDGLQARVPKPFVCTTDSRHAEPIAPNRLERAFAVGGVPDRVWVGDITYVPTDEGWLYLAVLLDLATRRAVGWAVSSSIDTELVSTAFARAVVARRPAPGLIHHSDRGSQYASAAYQAQLNAIGALPSMSHAGDCWDNAVAESFFSTLEWELLMGSRFPTFASAQRALTEFIDGWYNRVRLHSSLGYRSPMQYERFLQDQARAA